MTKFVCLLVISFYQRFLSPIKGFNCAHHRLHQGDTCSNAIKKILIEERFGDIVKLSRLRFRECHTASVHLASHRADIPCDISCAGDAGCLGDSLGPRGGKNCGTCTPPFELCLDYPRFKRRTQLIILSVIFLLGIFLAYIYGSQITKVEISQLPNSQRSDSFFAKLVNRDTPRLRALAVSDGNKIYSNVVESSDLVTGKSITLSFPRSLSLDQITRLELHDARFSAAQDLIIVGQTIDHIELPNKQGKGKRFRYKFKSRWGL